MLCEIVWKEGEHIFPKTAKAVVWGSTKIKSENIFLFWLTENHLLNQNSPLKYYSLQKYHGTSLFIPKGIYKHCTSVCWMYIPAKSTMIYSLSCSSKLMAFSFRGAQKEKFWRMFIVLSYCTYNISGKLGGCREHHKAS